MKKSLALSFFLLLGFVFMSCQTTGGTTSGRIVYEPGEIVNGKDGKPVLYKNKSMDIAIDISSDAIVIPQDTLSMMETDGRKVDFMMSHADLTGKTVMVSVENMGDEYAYLDDEEFTSTLLENPVFVGLYTEQMKKSLEDRGYTVSDVVLEELKFMGKDVYGLHLSAGISIIPIEYVVVFTKHGQYLRNVTVGATSYKYCLEQIAAIRHYK